MRPKFLLDGLIASSSDLVGALVWLLLVLLKSVVQLSLLLVVMAVARLGGNL